MSVMKKLVIFFGLLLIFGPSQAQDKLPSFGEIDKADLEMKDCGFDPGAEAVVLLSVGEIQYAYLQNSGWLLEGEYRFRIKILKESALKMANVKIRFYNKGRMEDLTNLGGITYNLDNDGNILQSKLERKEKYKKNIDEVLGETSFAMPDVRVGSVIEYRYKISVSTFGIIPSWNFQQEIPVKYSAYRVVIPQGFQFTVQTISRQPLEKKNTKAGGTWYIMRNIPAFKKEPMSAGESNYLQSVAFQLSKIDVPGYFYESTWPKIIESLLADRDFGDILKTNISIGDELSAALTGVTSIKEKMHIIYNYVQRNMLWNEDYAIEPYNSFTFFDAWDKKMGSIADINFMLIKLLQKAGIDAKPLLVSTKGNGAININYPSLNQFDAVMAYVKDGDQRYVMNAADKYNPYNLVPYDVVYTNALVVDKDNGGLVGLNNDKKFQNDIYFTVYVDADGGLTGNAALTSYNYARNIRMDNYKKNKLKELLEDNEGIKIQVDSISVKNEKDEMKPFLQEIQFSGNMQASGGYYFLPFGLFAGLGKNPFVDENRITDIDFEYPKKYVISGSYILTDNFIADELPKNKKMLMPDSSIELTRMVQKENNIISFRFTLNFNTPAYTAESYPLVKEFFKKMYAILDERIVLKKK
jgi:Domain of Unknown Function with PDB structure (DUF3857)